MINPCTLLLALVVSAGEATVDHTSDGIASLEIGTHRTATAPASCLPRRVKDGDVLVVKNGRLVIDHAETGHRREVILRTLARLRRNG